MKGSGPKHNKNERRPLLFLRAARGRLRVFRRRGRGVRWDVKPTLPRRVADVRGPVRGLPNANRLKESSHFSFCARAHFFSPPSTTPTRSRRAVIQRRRAEDPLYYQDYLQVKQVRLDAGVAVYSGGEHVRGAV